MVYLKLKIILSAIFILPQIVFAQGIIHNNLYIIVKSGGNININGNYKNIGLGKIKSDGAINIKGDWINSGTTNVFTDINTTGYVNFVGIIDQEIGGTKTTNFENINVNNANRVYLNQDIEIKHNLTLTNGKFDLKDKTVDLGTTGNIVNETETNCITATDANWVVGSNTGTIKTTQTIDDVTNLDPANLGCIITTNKNLGTITIIRGHKKQTNYQNSSIEGIARYYDIPGIGELYGTNTTLKMKYWTSELNGISETQLEGYQLVTYSDFWWTPLNGTAHNNTFTVSTSGNNVNNPSNPSSPYHEFITTHTIYFHNRFTLGSKITPLPIELISFEAVCQDYGKLITWTSASEINNDYYTLQKSKNGIDFYAIASITGAGNSNMVNNYQYFDDEQDLSCYYKLSQIDFDGSSETFDIIFANCTDEIETDFIVQQDFIKENILVQIIGEPYGNYSLYLINQLGQLLINKPININNKKEEIKLNTQDLRPGIYSVVFITDSKVISKQIVLTK